MQINRIQARWMAFLASIASFAILATAVHSSFGFPLDDSWIHQTVARNLSQTGILGYLPGIHSSGSSSLLWTLILALQYKFFGFLHPVVYSLILNGLLIGLTSVLLYELTQHDGMPAADSWILALAPVVSGNYLWLGLLGMEHVLFVVLSLATLWLWFLPVASRRSWQVAGTAILLALLVFTRPEGIFLVGVLLLFRQKANRSWADCGALVFAAAVAQAVSSWINWIASRTILPLTMKGRKFLYFGGSQLHISNFVAFERACAFRILKNWFVYASGSLQNDARLPVGLLALAGVVALMAVAGIVLLVRTYWRTCNRTMALLLWAAGLNLLYLIIFPNLGHGGRYQPFELLLAPAMVWIFILHTLRWLYCRSGPGSSMSVGPMWISAVIMLIASVLSWSTWRTLTRDGIAQINTEHGEMAAWIGRHLSPEDVSQRRLAAFDIGRIGYQVHGSLVDLGGLTDPELLPALMNGQIPRYLRDHGIQYVVLPTSPESPGVYAGRLLPTSSAPYTLQELATFCYPLQRTSLVMNGTSAAWPCQTVYRIEFPKS